MTSTRSNWSREQIRAARATELPPLLRRHGLRLHPAAADNFQVERYAGLIVKRSFWRWPERNMQGNVRLSQSATAGRLYFAQRATKSEQFGHFYR